MGAMNEQRALSTYTEPELVELAGILQNSLYPNAQITSIRLAISYCKSAGLDVMQKPVHIVPMWDSNANKMRDTIMPGIALYRIQASRSGQCAGIGEPEFGPEVTRKIGNVEVTYPEWCRVTVKRILPSGHIAEFTAVERWIENYAIKGGKEKSVAPNAMWMKRPHGQLAKCAEAQALRKAFPEFASAPTAEEMEGRALADEANTLQGDFSPAEGAASNDFMPKAKSKQAAPPAATDVPFTEVATPPAPAPAPPPAAPAGNDEPASEGMKNNLKGRIERRGTTIEKAALDAGVPGLNLDTLTKAQFMKVSSWFMQNPVLD